ncbi:MAG: hypothetical protein ACXWKP_12080 [Bradyrhizobium sp.]
MNPFIDDDVLHLLIDDDTELKAMWEQLAVADDAYLKAMEKDWPSLMSMDDMIVTDADKRLYETAMRRNEQIKALALTPKTPEQKFRQLLEKTLRLIAKNQNYMLRRRKTKKRH